MESKAISTLISKSPRKAYEYAADISGCTTRMRLLSGISMQKTVSILPRLWDRLLKKLLSRVVRGVVSDFSCFALQAATYVAMALPLTSRKKSVYSVTLCDRVFSVVLLSG